MNFPLDFFFILRGFYALRIEFLFYSFFWIFSTNWILIQVYEWNTIDVIDD